MKHFIRLVLVVAVLASVACADYMTITPDYASGPIGPMLIGDPITYTVYWHKTDDPTLIAGYSIALTYDALELDLIPASGAQIGGLGDHLYDPDLLPGEPWNTLRGIYNPYVTDDGAGNMQVDLLLIPDFSVAGTVIKIAVLDMQLVGAFGPDGAPDVVKLADVGNYGVGVQIEQGVYDLRQTDHADGASVMGIPEPTTTALLGIGLLGALLRKRS